SRMQITTRPEQTRCPAPNTICATHKILLYIRHGLCTTIRQAQASIETESPSTTLPMKILTRIEVEAQIAGIIEGNTLIQPCGAQCSYPFEQETTLFKTKPQEVMTVGALALSIMN